MLRTSGLTAGYGQFKALFGVDISMNAGETIAVIGANGAGKTTLMRAITGVLRNAPEQILFEEKPIGAMPPHQVMKLGIALVPEGRRLFPSLSVEENLLIGGQQVRRPGPWTLASIYELFPALREKRGVPATSLSGGQQQMVAMGRALMSNPSLLLCDEISLGLSPAVINDIYAALPRIKAEGAAIAVVEQDVGRALSVADRVYCMMEGHVTLTGRPADLSRAQIHDAYFGTQPSHATTPEPEVP